MNYLFAAYTAIWIILFVYISTLWKRQRRLAQELEALKKQTAEAQRAPR